jgi:hypothetical protein
LRTTNGEILAGLIIVFIIFLACFLFRFIPAYFRAEAFNHATGRSISTWDAMILGDSLRIVDTAAVTSR